MTLTQDIIGLHDGRTMVVHLPAACEGQTCCIHNPSSHALDTAPLNWRSDIRTMERVCRHGIGHPDPDDLAFKRRTLGTDGAWGFGIHGCDGCCREVAQP